MTKEEEDKKEHLYRVCKRIVAGEDWKYLVEEMQKVIEVHKLASLQYLSKKMIDLAQEQACIVKGIEEMIDRPNFIIVQKETSIKEMRRKYLTLISDKFRKKKEETKPI